MDGNEVMKFWLEEHRQMLCQAIAEFAVFCPVAEYDKMKLKDSDGEAYFRHNGNLIRRARTDETRRTVKDGVYLEDNSDINGKFKRLVKMSGCKNYITCHIYDLPYEADAFSAVANIVLLPEIIAGLSDTCDDVKRLLRYRVFELYGWRPRNQKTAPKKPEGYDKIKWNIPK